MKRIITKRVNNQQQKDNHTHKVWLDFLKWHREHFKGNEKSKDFTKYWDDISKKQRIVMVLQWNFRVYKKKRDYFSLTDGQIAKLVGCCEKYVSDVRKQLLARKLFKWQRNDKYQGKHNFSMFRYIYIKIMNLTEWVKKLLTTGWKWTFGLYKNYKGKTFNVNVSTAPPDSTPESYDSSNLVDWNPEK